MNALIHILAKSGLLTKDLDYRLLRASMVLIFLTFGYQKWFAYEAQVLIPYISNGPLISWLYPAFGIRGASWFLGVTEWVICLLLFWGFWNKQAGILGALGSCATFVGTVTIIPFMPNGWDQVAERSVSYEGCRASCCVILFAQARRRKGDPFCRYRGPDTAQ